MPQTSIHQCQCPPCQGDTLHPDQALHRQMNVFVSRLDEQQRHWYAALEASRLGHGGGQRVARITGLDVHTIRRGREELSNELSKRPADRVCASGAGRASGRKKDPLLEQALLDLVEPKTAGDPMGEQKWLCSRLRSLRAKLAHPGHQASAPTGRRLLKKHDCALRVNAKQKEAGAQHPERDAQFRSIPRTKNSLATSKTPVRLGAERPRG